ncbi:SRPBCC family protein [Bdellovibrio bacteriovorus]|uniref:SRPBCC family protein n=1 Tax=Bdellovibrio bacteriovorus TaxID=959 RepID=UPI003AA7CEF3
MEPIKSGSQQSAKHKGSSPHSKLLVIDRQYDVPLEKLFAAFSSPEALKQWWWPEGIYTDHVEWEFRNGGRYYINMKGYDQGGSGMAGSIEEVVKNERIVMTDQFANERGQPISAKEANMPGEWPEKGYITFEFESHGKERSGFKLSQEGIPNELQADCIQGWSQSFDKLQKYLSGPSDKH